MKRPRRFHYWPQILIVIISFILASNLLTPGVFTSHDGTIHIARLAQFTKALQEGHVPVRWLDNWYFGYGYPTFVYNYSLPYYIGAFIHLATYLDFESIFKLLLFASTALSGITCFAFLRTYFFQKTALFGSIVYISAPYRLADLYERGALGEALSFIFIPLLFLTPHKLRGGDHKWIIFSALIFFGFITTHALTLMIFLPIALLYAFYILHKQRSAIFLYCVSTALGFLLAAYQWFPMVFEQQYVELEKTYFSIYEGHLLPLAQLVHFPIIGKPIGTGIQVGLTQSIFLLAGFSACSLILLRRRSVPVVPLFGALLSIAAIFLITTYSKFLWDNVSPLRTLLFPWRFLTLTTFVTSFLAAYTISHVRLPTVLFLLLVILAITPSRHYSSGHGWHHQDTQYYQSFYDPKKLDVYLLPKGAPQHANNTPKEFAKVLSGDATLLLTDRKAANAKLSANVATDSHIQFSILNFPGWRLTRNGTEIPIEPSGMITSVIPAGTYTLTLRFTETPLRQLGNNISLVSSLGMAGSLLLGSLRRR